MGCSAFNGQICSVSGDSCMLLIPNSKACADMFGEGPDAPSDKCDDCQCFYLEDNKRCCTREPLTFIDGNIVKSKYIANGVTSCGAFKAKV